MMPGDDPLPVLAAECPLRLPGERHRPGGYRHYHLDYRVVYCLAPGLDLPEGAILTRAQGILDATSPPLMGGDVGGASPHTPAERTADNTDHRTPDRIR